MQKRMIILSIILMLLNSILTGCDTEAEVSANSEYAIILLEELGAKPIGINFSDNNVKDEMTVNISQETEHMQSGLQPLDSVEVGKSPHMSGYIHTIQCMEEYLPNVYALKAQLSFDIEIVASAEGDIGNDSFGDFVFILKSTSSITDAKYKYAVCVMTEFGDAYQCTAISYTLIPEGSHEWFYQNYEFETKIEAGEVYVVLQKNEQKAMTMTYRFMLQESQLILTQLTEDKSSAQSRAGEITVYEMQEGRVQSYAYSQVENDRTPRLIYEANIESVTGDFNKVTPWKVPEIVESSLVYAENGKAYDYRVPQLCYESTEEDAWKPVYYELIQAILTDQTEINSENIEFALLYINEDTIPELAVGNTGYCVSLFIYAPGKEYAGIKDVNVLMDSWGYGAMGNHGYDYYPYQNIIVNSNTDFGSEVIWYGEISAEYELVDKYYLCWEYENSHDENSSIIYTYNAQEISEEEFRSYIIKGETGYIIGDKLAYEVVEEMTGL